MAHVGRSKGGQKCLKNCSHNLWMPALGMPPCWVDEGDWCHPKVFCTFFFLSGHFKTSEYRTADEWIVRQLRKLESANGVSVREAPFRMTFYMNVELTMEISVSFLWKSRFIIIHTVCPSKIDTMPRNMLLIKNPQFSPNFDYTLPKWSAHWIVILTKCHKNWVKIVDFLLVAYFWAWCQFCLDILYIVIWDTIR